MPLAPEEDLSAAETLARAALGALRAGVERQKRDEGRGTGDEGAEMEAAANRDAEAERTSPSAAENLARVEERRQREWLYRGHRKTRGGWKRD